MGCHKLTRKSFEEEIVCLEWMPRIRIAVIFTVITDTAKEPPK